MDRSRLEVIGLSQKNKKQDGQKSNVKARLVEKGFQESFKPQADSPSALRKSLKVCLSIAANEDFDIAAIYIRAAFLQSKALNRDVKC